MRAWIALLLLLVGLVASVADRFPALPLVSQRPPVSSASTLNTSLISYWKLDEASGTRVDSEPTGTPQDLTDNNTVNQTNGVIGSAAWFIAANSEDLTRSDSADLDLLDEDWSISAWAYLDTTGANRSIVAKYTTTGNQRGYALIYSSSASRWQAIVSSNGVNTVTLNANTFGAPSISTWYHLVLIHDSVNNLLRIIVNGTEDSVSYGTGVFDSTSNFYIGNAGFSGAYHNGKIDEVGIWRKVLSASEITELRNSGSGKTCCPF